MNNPNDLHSQITALDKDVSSITKDQEIQNRAMVKIELTIDKLQTLTEAIHRLISIHEERINTHTSHNPTKKE